MRIHNRLIFGVIPFFKLQSILHLIFHRLTVVKGSYILHSECRYHVHTWSWLSCRAGTDHWPCCSNGPCLCHCSHRRVCGVKGGHRLFLGNGDSPPRHPVVRLTGGDDTEKTGLKLTETSQNQKKCTQQTNKILENRTLKITNPFCFYGHIHEVTSYIIRHHPSLVNGRRLNGIVTVALSEVAM